MYFLRNLHGSINKYSRQKLATDKKDTFVRGLEGLLQDARQADNKHLSAIYIRVLTLKPLILTMHEAIKAIKASPIPLQCGNDARALNGIGPVIASHLDKFLVEESVCCSSLQTDTQNTPQSTTTTTTTATTGTTPPRPSLALKFKKSELVVKHFLGLVALDEMYLDNFIKNGYDNLAVSVSFCSSELLSSLSLLLRQSSLSSSYSPWLSSLSLLSLLSF